jgi:hypothetical protein
MISNAGHVLELVAYSGTGRKFSKGEGTVLWKKLFLD